MKRRDFLKTQAGGAAWLAAGATGLLVPVAGLADIAPDVAVVKGKPGAATRAAVGMLGGMESFVEPGQRVLIKPNMSFAEPVETATNTHPEVVRELAAMCKEAGASSVLILDHTLGSPKRCLERSGILEASETVAPGMVHAINNGSFFSRVDIPQGDSLTRSDIAKEVLKADVLIAAPVAKSHSGAGVSLSMKGMMGLIYDRDALHWRGLDTCIVDLNTVIKADLAVIDGSRVLTTNGPRGPGRVVVENTIIAGRDLVATDATAVSLFEWYGRHFKPRQVPHIRMAHERGLGRMDIENLAIESISL